MKATGACLVFLRVTGLTVALALTGGSLLGQQGPSDKRSRTGENSAGVSSEAKALFGNIQRVASLLEEVEAKAGEIQERQKSAGVEERSAEQRKADRRAMLEIMTNQIGPAERRMAAAQFARAMNLGRDKRRALVAISEDREEFLSRFDELLPEEAAPKPLSNDKVPVNWTDWGCRWAGNPTELGTEVGPDYWPAAYVCFLARLITGLPACLVVHHHEGWWGAIVWAEPAVCL